MTEDLSHASLAAALARAASDALRNAPRFDPPPSIDLAVVAFPRGAPPVWANVLFSRDHPEGWVAALPADGGPVQGLQFLADVRDAQGNSIAWAPGSDWRRAPLQPLWGEGPQLFLAPYPASLIKLMVAVGVARLVDQGAAGWDEAWAHGGSHHSVAQWAEAMIVISSNEATDALVALLHARGLIRRDGGAEHNGLQALFQAHGLPTLRLAGTQPGGGWRNGDGSGVGQLQMTAWDTVRLLWLLLDEPAAPWRAAGTPPLLARASRQRLWQWLAAQELNEVLSSTLVAGLPGWVGGIPARQPARRLLAASRVDDPAVGAASARADAHFAHKTGNTANYASDAGLVRGDGGRRYLIALLSSLGQRHAPHPDAAVPWCVPQIGAAVDAWLKQRLE